jgi:hypothetical protein
MSQSSRPCDEQNTIILEHIEGELINPDNFTPALGRSSKSSAHMAMSRGMSAIGRVQNFLVSSSGNKFDFERSLMALGTDSNVCLSLNGKR